MIQFAVFQVTEANKAEEQEALNAFLRSHRILTVENGFRLCCSAAPQEEDTAVPAVFPFPRKRDENEGRPAQVAGANTTSGHFCF